MSTSTIILITGANSGIGFATAKALANASPSYHIILTARTFAKAQSAKSEIESTSTSLKGTLSALQLDVTSEQSVQDAVAHVEAEFGHLDVLVNNAGVGGLHEPNLKKRFDTVLETNVTGPAVVALTFRPLLLKSANPYSIYIGSGQRTIVRNALAAPADDRSIIRGSGSAYIVSKAALNMLAVLESREFGPKGLKVFVVSPGFVRSNLRGTSEEERSGWGGAGDPDESGEIVLSVVRGEKDGDVGCLVHKDGVYPW